MVKTLTGLAEARQAAVSQQTYNLYAAHLAEFEDADVKAAARYIARKERADGETAFPSLGKLIAEVKYVRAQRLEQERARSEKEQRIGKFWREVLPFAISQGRTEAEMLERFPEFKGTRI